MLIPFPPGGGPDAVGRLIAQTLSARWGHAVVVENVGGASGQIGTQAVVRAPADGYTLLFSPPTPITIAEHFTPRPSYDITRDLTPVALIGRNPAVIVCPAQIPARTLPELFALARAEPDRFFYGSPGQGHAFHLITELLLDKARVKMTHVPYQGSAKAVIGLMSGDVQMLVQSVEAVREFVRAGRLRALVTLEDTRLDALPDVPTLKEAAMPSLGVMNWYGAFFPSRTPPAIIAFWESTLIELAREPGFQARMRAMSFDPVAFGSLDFQKIMTVEREQWAQVIRAANISAQK